MIIVFNQYDTQNWQWIQENGGAEDVYINWYDDEERTTWLASGGTNKLSAFPSVMDSPSGNVIYRMPNNRAECLFESGG